MKNRLFVILNWLVVLWVAKVFLASLPYKFTNHPDTQHIFGTIGKWMQGVLGDSVGIGFSQYGAIGVGVAELLVTLLLLSPALLFVLKKMNVVANPPSRALIHAFGGLAASGIMAGAVFFHLFTPLGIEVIHEGKSDGGSLFYAAVSILVLGLVMFVSNWKASQQA